MPPRILLSFPRTSFSIPSSRLFVFPAQLQAHARTNSTLGSSAAGSVINVQQIPAPGAGHIRILLLNRPDARNALSRKLLDSLEKHVDGISAEDGVGPTRALILASNVDSSFCAGADLKERVGFTKEEYVHDNIVSIGLQFGSTQLTFVSLAERPLSWPSFEALLIRFRHCKFLRYQPYLPWRLVAVSN